jgi:glycine oxidase
VTTYDIAIAGGGIIGSAIAFERAQAGKRVVLFDRQQPGLEASWAAAGMLAPGAETPDSVMVAPLGKASLDLYPQFVDSVEDASGLDVQFEQKPGLQIFFGDAAYAERAEFVRVQRGLGLPAEEISVEEALRAVPALSLEARAVAWLEREARVDNRRLLEAVFAAAVKCGVELRAGQAATGLLLRGGKCLGLTTPAGENHAGQVVIAAGSFCAQLEDFRKYAPTSPVRGQMAALRSSTTELRNVLRSHRGYIVPRQDGRLICGSTAERVGFEKRVTADGLQKILTSAVELVPALADASVVESWSGLRPDTPDHLPSIGPTDVPGLFIAAGHYRNGILLTPITVHMMRNYLETGVTKVAGAENYSPMRFAAVR